MSIKGMKMMIAKGELEDLNSIDMGRKCSWKWSIQMFGDHLQYHHLEDPDSMLLSLMISAGRYEFTS